MGIERKTTGQSTRHLVGANALVLLLCCLISLMLSGGCAGVHGTVVVDTPKGPVEVRFADDLPISDLGSPISDPKSEIRNPRSIVAWGSGGGAAVSPYHSEGQSKVVRDEGYIAHYRRYVEPLQLRPGQRLLYFYPYTLRGWGYQLRQNRDEPGLNWVARELHSRGIELIVYLAKPTTGDTWGIASFEDQVAEIRRLFAFVPKTAAIALDEGASSSAAGRVAIEEERKAGRRIYFEPMQFTYAPWAHVYPTVENSDHYERTKDDATRVAEKGHTLILHHSFPEGWDYGACVLEWARECEAQGLKWIVQAEPLVNAAVRMTMDNVDPRRN